MIFNPRFCKFGKGFNLSAFIKDNIIHIYYFNNGILKKELTAINNKYDLNKTNLELSYDEVIPINDNYLLTRIEKNLGIIKNEK